MIVKLTLFLNYKISNIFSMVLLQTALRLQRLKEARDYSFLFTDEDPTTSTPAPATNTQHPTTSAHRNGTHEPASRRQG
jgi:hypothetical protein